MEYAVGRTGRIIAARLFEGEDLYESVHEIAVAENIKSAAVFITGGFREANVVVGPKQEEPTVLGEFRGFRRGNHLL
ncbi:MAG: PCC domain-containing protein [Planctomycetota bacterium]|jgi:predicted DNA-binding protein with PD1-like motif